jgi:hypothetical protein
VVAGLVLAAAPAAAQSAPRLDVATTIQADGGAPFDADDASGHDSDQRSARVT